MVFSFGDKKKQILANIVSDVKKKCVGADVQKDGLAIKGSQAKKSKQKVAEWL